MIEKNGANVVRTPTASNHSIVHIVSRNENCLRSWRRLSSITFIIDIFSFDQHFRNYREKVVPKTSKREFS